MRREHHFLLWAIVIIIAIFAWQHYKQQMGAARMYSANIANPPGTAV